MSRRELKWRSALTRALLGGLMVIAPTLSSAQALPMASTDDAERQSAVAAAAEFPLHYAVGLIPSLTQIDLADGGITVFSAGARSLGLRIHLQNWPEDQPLQWQSADQALVHHIEPGQEETLWLPDVPGDMAHLRWPQEGLPDDAHLTLELVYHGFRGVYGPQARAAGDSGSCNVDVSCSEGASWRDPVRATTLITVGTGLTRSQCSGAVLNNTANNGRPLLITARHCGITQSNAASLNVVFNFQRSSCGGGNDGDDMRDVVRGATLLGESARADTTLVVLNSAIPSGFGAVLAAWSAEPVAPTSGAGIHHPSGDQKKISLFSRPASGENDVRIGGGTLLRPGGFNVDAWRVQWSRGVTEGGSSGSGLWNQNRALVGVLSGGASGCASPNGNDFYGRLAVAWDESAAIRNALDPVSGGSSRSSGGRSSGGGSAGDGGGGSPGGALLLMLGGIALWRRRLRGRKT